MFRVIGHDGNICDHGPAVGQDFGNTNSVTVLGDRRNFELQMDDLWDF